MSEVPTLYIEPITVPSEDLLLEADALLLDSQFNLSDSYFTPTKYLNLTVKLSEEKDSAGNVISSEISLNIEGLSGTAVANINVDKLPPEGAQKLLETLITGQPDLTLADRQFVAVETMTKFLTEAVKLGGKVFSEDLGIFPKRITKSYSKLIHSAQYDQTNWEYLTNNTKIPSWNLLVGDLIASIKDENTFVWIRAETPLSTGRAHEDKLDFIIKNIIDECVKSENPALKEVLEEAWIKERGASFDLRIIKSIDGEHFKVDKSKLLVLAGKGFVMTVFDGDHKIKEELYRALENPINEEQFAFLFNALEFGVEKNESLITKLYKRQSELQSELPYKNRDKSIDLAEIADNIEQLIDSARYIRDESEDYIHAINDYPKKGQKEDHLNVINDCLDYARDVHQTALSLHEDCGELRNRVKEIREEIVNDLNVLTSVSTPLWTITTIAMVWRDFDLVSFGIIGTLSLFTALWYNNIKKKTSG